MSHKIDPILAQHEHLKLALRLKGTSMAKQAKRLGVTQSTLSLVSKGKNRSRRLERELAKAVGKTPEQLFPERYPEQKSHKQKKERKKERKKGSDQ